MKSDIRLSVPGVGGCHFQYKKGGKCFGWGAKVLSARGLIKKGKRDVVKRFHTLEKWGCRVCVGYD